MAAQILSFYCPGLEPERLGEALSSMPSGGALSGYAWGATTLLDVLFGAALYRTETLSADRFETL